MSSSASTLVLNADSTSQPFLWSGPYVLKIAFCVSFLETRSHRVIPSHKLNQNPCSGCRQHPPSSLSSCPFLMNDYLIRVFFSNDMTSSSAFESARSSARHPLPRGQPEPLFWVHTTSTQFSVVVMSIHAENCILCPLLQYIPSDILSIPNAAFPPSESFWSLTLERKVRDGDGSAVGKSGEYMVQGGRIIYIRSFS